MTESTAKKYQLRCHDCGLETDETITCTLCKRCGGVLEVLMDFKVLKEKINENEFKDKEINALKYLDFYPLGGSVKVSSLGEGSTPLIRMERINKELGIDNVFVKNEGANPTGVFKDRGSLVEIAKARQLGEEAIVVASSGNMAASCAAYAAKSGIKCYVLIPAQTPVGKLAQIISYGAEVVKVKGEYSDCVKFARRLSEDHKMYLAGDYVFRREGQKSLAYELCEQFEYKVPAVVVCPTGAGTNLAAIWKGFKDFYQLGLIKSLPKMVAVQAEGASPLAEAFKIGKKIYIEWKKTSTLCSAVAVADPTDGKLALEAVYDSGGSVVTVADKDALGWERILASKEALFVEPSAALSVACLEGLVKSGTVNRDDEVVCIASGSGLKDPVTVIENLPEPPVFEKDYEKISRHFCTLR